jgi:4-hydroxybenzoate polyprenyltransferase
MPTMTEPPVATPVLLSREVAVSAVAPARERVSLRVWISLIRPRQWTKNFFVLAPVVFAGRIVEPAADVAALTAFLVFCLVASGVYVGNDIVDREADRAHPVKRARPIAAGVVPVRQATLVGAGLVMAALALALTVNVALLGITLTYLLLNVLYSLRLKQMVILDVFAIAAFFVLRLLAGAAAIEVRPSVWLLLCGGLLALYLAFTKRRHELTLLGEESASHRTVLSEYSTGLLDQISIVLLSVTIISYVMYTLTSPTAAQVGSEALSYSAIFVIYGVFRYLYLVHRRNGGSPTETLLTDRALLLNVVLWLLYCGWVVYRPF